MLLAGKCASDPEGFADNQIILLDSMPQVSDDAFLNEALAAGLADGAYAAGQQTDYNRMLLFAMEEPPEVAHGAYDAEQWQHIRWLMLRSTRNPAALSGVVDFIARRLVNGRVSSKLCMDINHFLHSGGVPSPT